MVPKQTSKVQKGSGGDEERCREGRCRSVMKIDGTLIELAKPSTIRVVHGVSCLSRYILNDGILPFYSITLAFK